MPRRWYIRLENAPREDRICGSSRSAASSAAAAASWESAWPKSWAGTTTIGRSSIGSPPSRGWSREILRSIAALGSDCVIIGRDADVILEAQHPFRVSVCAEMDARLGRCMKYELRRPEAEQLTEKQVLRNIRRIDRNRARTREILTGRARSDSSTFDLTVNAASWDIKKLVEATAEFATQWFEQ